MAVGDIIVARAASGDVFFQPAASVEIMITAVMGTTSMDVGIYSLSAAASSKSNQSNTAYTGGRNTLSVKIGITNANYLYMYSNSGSAYSGIQIK